MNSRDLVYGHAWHHDCLAFADGRTAEKEADEIVAIATAPTLGTAAAIVPEYTWNPAAVEVDDTESDADSDFDIHDCGSVQDGDWPPMVTSRALSLLPREIIDMFGQTAGTALNGDYLLRPEKVGAWRSH